MTPALSLVISGILLHEKYLDHTDVDGSSEKPESLEKIGTVRLNYSLIRGLDLFAKAEYTDAERDLSDDYERFRGSFGAGYTF